MKYALQHLFHNSVVDFSLTLTPSPPPSPKMLKGTDHAGTFMSLNCVVYYANYSSWHQSSKIQVVP